MIPELVVLLRWALGVSLVLGLLLPLAMGTWHALVGFALALAIWIVVTAVLSFRKSLKQTRAHWGMAVAHIGVAVFVVGVSLVKGYDAEKDVKMRAGDTVELNGYVFRLEAVSDVKGPNYVAARADMSVAKGGKPVARLFPEKRIYTVQDMPMTEAAIDPGLTRDLYVSLGDQLSEGTWLVRVQVKPFIDWIWASASGCRSASSRWWCCSASASTSIRARCLRH